MRSPHMFTRKPRLQLEKFAINGAWHGSIVELPMPTRFTRRQLSMVGASALGASATAATANYGFLYDNGSYATLSTPFSPTNTWAYDINNQGQIVGSAINQGFLYSNGSQPHLIGTAFGIND